MRNLILGLLLLTFSIHAEHAVTGGTNGADLSKVPEIGLVEKKVAARNGEAAFTLPDAPVQRLDNWFRENKASLTSTAWNDPKKVDDDKVLEVKKSLGSYLLATEKEAFGKSIRIGVAASGSIKIEFAKTGQSFTYTPGPEEKYEKK